MTPISWPSTRGRTVTVLRGTTDPSARRWTGTSARETVATVTGTRGGEAARLAGAAAGRVDIHSSTATAAARPHRTTMRRGVCASMHTGYARGFAGPTANTDRASLKICRHSGPAQGGHYIRGARLQADRG